MKLQGLKIMVTGGAGFIGSNMISYILRKYNNTELSVIDNLSTGKLEFIDAWIESPRFHFFKEDLKNKERVYHILKKFRPDIVFHFAADPDVRKGASSPEINIKEGFLTTFYLLEAMRRANVKNIVFSSTSTVYGIAPLNTTETYGPLLPISIYGAAKLGAEALISSYCGSFNFKAWIFRFANVIGPNSTHGVIFDFIKKLRKNPDVLEILGDGQQRKSYLFVRDCISAMIYVLENDCEKKSCEIYNIGSEDTISVKEIAEIVASKMGLSPELRYSGGRQGWIGDVPQMHLSIEKIKKLGWKPEKNSRESVESTVDLYLKNI